MFPEDELEKLLGLVQRLSNRITQIDELGMLDASVLGEVVHPRTFNTIRRIEAGDESVLDEEEMRAELGGPETLLKQLREILNKEGAQEVVNLPDGIHSGLRREKCNGMFFYFKAPRPGGDGFRHYWRYIDAKSRKVTDNRFQIAQMIACRADEKRYIGDQDVFALQELVIQDILKGEQTLAAKSTLAGAPDKLQQSMAENVKNALRRGGVEREKAKAALHFLSEPAGKGLLSRLKETHRAWTESRDDNALIAQLLQLSLEYGKGGQDGTDGAPLDRTNLHLVCFEYISA
jgi:hypothetical protein